MLEKLQKAFDDMGVTDEVSISFDITELSTLIALVKSNNIYEKSLEESMMKTFSK